MNLSISSASDSFLIQTLEALRKDSPFIFVSELEGPILSSVKSGKSSFQLESPFFNSSIEGVIWCRRISWFIADFMIPGHYFIHDFEQGLCQLCFPPFIATQT